MLSIDICSHTIYCFALFVLYIPACAMNIHAAKSHEQISLHIKIDISM